MKVLSGNQPWWHALVHLGKRCENRVWNTHHRGPVLLHASKGVGTRDEFHNAIEAISDVVATTDDEKWVEFRDGFLGITTDKNGPLWLPGKELLRGGIIGRANIVDVIAPGDHGACSALVARGVDMRWWIREQYGWILEDVEPLPFYPCKGSLGLWDFDEKLLEART